ncbi:hypothetical protein NC652_038190 [Populus alba x Populus x berolinensis]|nr:hypothetical protein NC652_038190 [Populus alba x Populus x berolinensis]
MVIGSKIFNTTCFKKSPSQYSQLSSDARLWVTCQFPFAFPASCSKVTSKHDMSLLMTCPIFALGTLVRSF